MDGDRPAVVRVELCRQDHADADADAAADANANAGRGRKGWLVACKEHSMSTTIDRESPPHAVGPETDNGSLGLLAKSYLDVVSPHLQRSDFGIAMVQLVHGGFRYHGVLTNWLRQDPSLCCTVQYCTRTPDEPWRGYLVIAMEEYC